MTDTGGLDLLVQSQSGDDVSQERNVREEDDRPAKRMAEDKNIRECFGLAASEW